MVFPDTYYEVWWCVESSAKEKVGRRDVMIDFQGVWSQFKVRPSL